MKSLTKNRCTRHLVGPIALLFNLSVFASSEDARVTLDPAEGSKPYQQLQDALRRHEQALPPSMNIHPKRAMYNKEAVVPPQCYTKTEGTFNPCYVCHQDAIPGRENVMNDRELQIEYSFSDLGMTNHWENLFEDRSERVAQISDDSILSYVDQDNYTELADRLQTAGFKGWIPDMKGLNKGPVAFDEQGFAKDGSQWVAFSYKPFPSTFWPTNGSTDDVMIRLPERFRIDASGKYSRVIYQANLAILEANIKGTSSIAVTPLDENAIGSDLNDDGRLGTVDRISKLDRYVGAARDLYLDRHLYPKDTEFMHSVRYLGIDKEGGISVSQRMKELRYMRKWKDYAKMVYARQYELESFEKEAGHLPGYQNLQDYGLDNGNGWSIQGFIEDKDGRLRANTYEENFFCMGCHNSVGSTIDKTFSFARKIDGPAGWKYIDLNGMPDAPTKGEVEGEILTYLERVGGGSEFRNNEEMQARWFKPDGTLDKAKVTAAKDVYELITPSKERALLLNKAYKTIVEDQDYIYGRDPILTPPLNVYSEIDNEETPTLPEDKTYDWNILLDWPE